MRRARQLLAETQDEVERDEVKCSPDQIDVRHAGLSQRQWHRTPDAADDCRRSPRGSGQSRRSIEGKSCDRQKGPLSNLDYESAPARQCQPCQPQVAVSREVWGAFFAEWGRDEIQSPGFRPMHRKWQMINRRVAVNEHRSEQSID